MSETGLFLAHLNSRSLFQNVDTGILYPTMYFTPQRQQPTLPACSICSRYVKLCIQYRNTILKDIVKNLYSKPTLWTHMINVLLSEPPCSPSAGLVFCTPTCCLVPALCLDPGSRVFIFKWVVNTTADVLQTCSCWCDWNLMTKPRLMTSIDWTVHKLLYGGKLLLFSLLADK